MKKYNVTFKTSEMQEKPFAMSVEAYCRAEAIAAVRAEAQIPSRFIISCKLAK